MLHITFLSCKESTDKTLPYGILFKCISKPLGSAVQHPRLNWKIITRQDGFRQSAYHVFVGIESAHSLDGKTRRGNREIRDKEIRGLGDE